MVLHRPVELAPFLRELEILWTWNGVIGKTVPMKGLNREAFIWAV
jgi:hypothetical protein